MNGKRVVITREMEQAQQFAEVIRQVGGEPLIYPCIAYAPLTVEIPTPQNYDWLIFTSRNTVRAMQGIDYSGVKIAAIGKKTAAVLSHPVDFIPSSPNAASLATELPICPGERVLIPCSALAAQTLANGLTMRGAVVNQLAIYTMTIGTGGDDVPRMLDQNQVDILTFTSPSTVRNFLKRVNDHPNAYHLPAVCIGDTTAQAAIMNGFKHVYSARGSMIEVLCLI
ncbi:MAG: uroporphyrinogen-III synthase [Chloroflexi bacterium]|nr:MAG: uroporphyrinogen-III synthase [Chloroflexota bacterium]